MNRIIERLIKFCIGYNPCYPHCKSCLYSSGLLISHNCTKFWNMPIEENRGCIFHAQWSKAKEFIDVF